MRATSGNEALRQLLKREFAVMLLDVQMPGMSGYEVAALARADTTTREVPIIFVTAMHPTEEIVLRGYGSGAVDVLFKPIDPFILRSKVAVFLDLYAGRERKRIIETLEESLRARDEFLAIAAHELRTPLTAIQLEQEMILRRMRQRPTAFPDAKLVAMGEKAIRMTSRLERLVNTLLDVSRITTGRLSLELGTVDLVALARDVTAQFDEMLMRAGCVAEISSRAPTVIGRWDRARIEEVIGNLLANAVKFAPGSPIEISVTGDGDRARLAVRDHGIGIPPEDQARVFDRFERAVSSRNYGGLGLGLYITRRIVEAHGGSISLESTPGQGATFTVSLPVLACPR